jgi:hypothetical protein
MDNLNMHMLWAPILYIVWALFSYKTNLVLSLVKAILVIMLQLSKQKYITLWKCENLEIQTHLKTSFFSKLKCNDLFKK